MTSISYIAWKSNHKSCNHVEPYSLAQVDLVDILDGRFRIFSESGTFGSQ